MAVNARKESIVPDLSKKIFRANYPKLLSTGEGGGGGGDDETNFGMYNNLL
jgi:hypothetical protein